MIEWRRNPTTQAPSGRYIVSADAYRDGELIPMGNPPSRHGHVMAVARDLNLERAESELLERMALAERLYA